MDTVIGWGEFLRLLVQPNGIELAVGVLLSFLIEYVPGYELLAPRWKRLIFLGVCLAVPLVAAGLGVLTVAWPASWLDTFWPALASGWIAFAAGTAVHTRKLRSKPRLDITR